MVKVLFSFNVRQRLIVGIVTPVHIIMITIVIVTPIIARKPIWKASFYLSEVIGVYPYDGNRLSIFSAINRIMIIMVRIKRKSDTKKKGSSNL